MIHVPYKGAAPAVQDIAAGHATTGIHDLGTVGAHLQSGKLVALAVTGPRRWPLLADLPTFAEQGYGLDMAGWNGIHAPAGTPRTNIERMSAEINRVLHSAEGREQMLKFGLLATGAAAAHAIAESAGGDLRRLPAQRVQGRVRANLGD